MRKFTAPPKFYLPALVFGAFLLPIKLSFAYCVLIPFIIYATIQALNDKRGLEFIFAPLNSPLIIFLATACLTGMLGLNPAKSSGNLLSALGMTLIIPLYSSISKTNSICLVLGGLIAGQTVAATHSIFARIIPNFLPGFFVGEVTESGQIGLSLLAACGLIGYLANEHQSPPDANISLGAQKILGLLVGSLVVVCCFANSFAIDRSAANLGLIVTFLLVTGLAARAFQAARNNPSLRSAYLPLLVTIALPFLSSALLINLKRGPWAGVLVGLSVYFLAFRPRVIIPLLAVALLLVTSIEPIRERIVAAHEHFFISGGRSEIWDIGKELLQSYPLGIGFKNSSVLQKFSSEVPANLRHFHSNPINIAVETGLLGLAIFAWWIFILLRSAKNTPYSGNSYHPLSIAIGAAIISWQVAGLVEYNIGDSEVLYVAYVLVGLLGALNKSSHLSEL